MILTTCQRRRIEIVQAACNWLTSTAHNFNRKQTLTRGIFLLLLLVIFSGCGGDVNWFPEYERQPTDPDPFTFQSDTNAKPGEESTSEAITVKGLATSTTKAPIRISPSTSKYSINGGTATSNEGTVVNGDKITVTQTASSSAGQSVTSTLTIGNVSGTFTTTTRSFDLTFGTPYTLAENTLVAATLQTTGSGAHTISITDSKKDGFATYSLDGGVTFTNSNRTVSLNNGAQIFVRNLTTNVNSGVTTTLTIDKVDFDVPFK